MSRMVAIKTLRVWSEKLRISMFKLLSCYLLFGIISRVCEYSRENTTNDAISTGYSDSVLVILTKLGV